MNVIIYFDITFFEIDRYSEDDVDGFFLDKEEGYLKYETSKNRSAQQTFSEESLRLSEQASKPNDIFKWITKK
ncbi:hypothetical protein [Apilactobacillus kunkeei]|uniref:hypothetical protein n=1 Tax=Apilactobacillus kunkeei TaxID=148814 RepID=UPI0015E86E93|nr:hypothetical protein [Apilactobacillus kunkeei]